MADIIGQRFVPAFPVAALVPHPDNTRIADDAMLDASLDALGFYGAIVVQEGTNIVLAGWHRAERAAAAGVESVPAFVVAADDTTARRIMVVDNRASDLASNDDADLAALLGVLVESESGLTGTGYDEDDLASLLMAASETPFAPGPPTTTVADADLRTLVLVYDSIDALSAVLDDLDALGAVWGLDTPADVVARLCLGAP